MKTLFFTVLLFSWLIYCDSEPLPTSNQEAINAVNFYTDQARKNMEQATPEVEVLSGTSQKDLSATEQSLKNAINAHSENIEVPLGLTESDANSLTEIREIAKNIEKKIDSHAGGVKEALKGPGEAAIIDANENLSNYLQSFDNPSSTPVPTIPPIVTRILAKSQVSTKDFVTVPKKKPAAPSSSVALQARKIFTEGDIANAGDRAMNRHPVHRKRRMSPAVSSALNRLHKNLQHAEHANEVEIHMFDQNKEFNKLAKQMKYVQTALERIPTAEETRKINQNAVNARNNAMNALVAKKSPVELNKLSHEAISSAKVKVMLDFVKDLDELGRFFGEDELADEDDTLSITEDPKINIANSNFAAAVNRIKADLKANPNAFAPDRHLHDIAHYMENPVPISHAAPTDSQDNLTYLRNLRNYVVSLRENENKA